jgi:hypothetical protein
LLCNTRTSPSSPFQTYVHSRGGVSGTSLSHLIYILYPLSSYS